MFKEPSGGDRNPKPAQADASPNAREENASQIVEMAAEQLADLLWRHWLYMKTLKSKDSKESDS